MNTCEQIQTELSAYLDGEIAAGERGALEAHIQSCAACRAAMQDLESVRAALADLPKFKAPPSLASRIHSAVNAPVSAPVPLPDNPVNGEGLAVGSPRTISYERQRQKNFWRPALVAVAAMLMAGVIVFLFLPSLSGPQGQGRVAFAPAKTPQVNIGPAPAPAVNLESRRALTEPSKPAAGKPAMQTPAPAPTAEENTVLAVRELPAKEDAAKPAAQSAKRAEELQDYKDAKAAAALQRADKEDSRGRPAQNAKDALDRQMNRGENGIKAGKFDDAAQAPAAAAAPMAPPAPTVSANAAPPGAMHQDKAKDAQQAAQSGQPLAEKKKSEAQIARDETALDGKLQMRAAEKSADAEEAAGGADKTAGERTDSLNADAPAKSMRKIASTEAPKKPSAGQADKSGQLEQAQQAQQAEQLKLEKDSGGEGANAAEAAAKKQISQKGSGAGGGVGGSAAGDLGLGGPQSADAQPAKPGRISTPPPSAQPMPTAAPAPAVAQAQAQLDAKKIEPLNKNEPKADMPVVARATTQPDSAASNAPPAQTTDRAKDAVRPAEAQGGAGEAKETEKKEASKAEAVKLPQDAASATPANGPALDRRTLAPKKPSDLGAKFGAARTLASNVRTLTCTRSMLPALLAELRKAAGPEASLSIAPAVHPSEIGTSGTSGPAGLGGVERYEHDLGNYDAAATPGEKIYTLKFSVQQQDAVLARIDALSPNYRARSLDAKQLDADKVNKPAPVAAAPAAKPDASAGGQAQGQPRADEKPKSASNNIGEEGSSPDGNDDDRKAGIVITIRIQVLPDAAPETPAATPSDR